MSFIKNIEQEKIIALSKEITAAPGQVVSKTFVQNSAVSVTLFAFSKGDPLIRWRCNGFDS
jgi:hypothetical protein